MDGPTPVVQGLAPSLVCGEQVETTVTLTGDQLSPLAIEAATGDPLLAVPEIRLRRLQDAAGTPADGPELVLPNDPASPETARVVWTSATSMSFTVYPELGLEPGLYEVTVTNRNGKTATLTAALASVPRPALASAEPDLICLAQGGRPITLHGSGFLDVGGVLPSVSFGDGLVLPVESVEDCADVAGPTAARSCATAHLTMPADALAAGAYPVAVTNPSPAGCHSTDAVTIAIVPPPRLDAIAPDLVCLAEGERGLIATGADFLVVDGVYPTLTFSNGTTELAVAATAADGCTAVEGTILGAQACSSLELTLGLEALPAGAWSVKVENPAPAGCESDELVEVAVVPPPSLLAAVPDLACLAEGERSFTLEGAGFVVLEGATYPTVTIGGIEAAVAAADGCATIDGTLLAAKACDTLTVTVAATALEPGAYEVRVANPDPAGCTSTELVTVAIVPPPVVTAVVPDLLCGSAGATLTVRGAGFVAVGASLPIVHLGAAAIVADDVDGCTPIDGTLASEAAVSCTSLAVTVPADAVAAGALPLVVENPAPAGCASTEAVTVAVIGAPAITALAPAAICQSAPPAEMTATGSSFLVLRGAPDVLPAVLVDGAATTVTAVGGCAPLAGTSLPAEACTSITFALPALAAGPHGIHFVNPDPAGCSTGTEAAFDVAAAPVLAAVEPFQICASGGDFTVSATGAATGFAGGAQIGIRPSGSASFTPIATAWLDATHVQGTVGSGLTPGLYDVTVENGAGCEATPLASALDLVAAPFVYFADPPVVYDGIDLTVTVYASGVTGSVQAVTALPADGSAGIPLDIVDASQAGRVQVVVPAGALAAGSYDLAVEDSLCASVLAAGLTVTSSLTVSVEAINPPFGWTGERVAVEITSAAPPPAGMANFAATPRVYLSPRTTGGVATELRALSFLDPTRLSGSIPAGLPVDRYNLVVVNPDGSVGLLADAFQVLADPPPVVELLVPGSVPSQDNMVVTVAGSGFEADATVAATCRWVDDLGGVYTASLAADVTFVDAGTLTTSWDFATAGVPNSAVCVLRITNTGDATYADFSALSVTPASNTPNDFDPANALNVGRRALAGAALRMNSIDRLVFAIGGDNGLAGAARVDYASVEGARVDPYGVMEPWVMQRNELPQARSFTTAATVGRFVYLPGGRVGGTQATSVLRAYLLDPEEAPGIAGLDLALDDTLGLDPGLWVYRIAAVLSASDPSNPGGEGLASEPVTLHVPAVDGKRVQLTLLWDAVPNATAYRIYRTPTVDGVAGEERLLDEIAAIGGMQHYVDDGQRTIDPATAPAPLPLGSLGVWHPVGNLTTAREGAAVVAVPDPNDASKTYLHVLGGLSAGVALSSAEHATITETAANNQTLSAFTDVASVLPNARWQTAAVYVDHSQVSIIPATDAWIYLLPGLTAGGGAVSHVTAYKIDTADGLDADDGGLGAGIEVDSPTASAGGYGALARNGFLYILAGAGTADAAGKAAQICTSAGAGCAGGAPEPPDLVMWNAGIQMTEGRILNGTASESGFVFVVGGQTETSPATSTTESTNI